MASVAPEVAVEGTVVEGTVAAPLGGDAVVAGTVVSGGDSVGHPALLSLPPGVEYVRAQNVPFAPLLTTDAVVDVFALDRSLFDAANAAKRRVHLCNGAPGTLDYSGDNNFCVALGGPFVPPWTAHFVIFCPIVMAPQICNLVCFPHKDMEVPPWADHALIVTDKGVVGRRYMRPDKTPEERAKQQAFYARWNHEVPPYERDINAIAWDGFDVDKIEVRRYAEDDKTCYWNCDEPPGHPDPLSYALGFGLLAPCCWKVLCNPTTPGLYRAKIKSDHTTTVSSGDSSTTYNTAQISLIALARSPEDLLESLRAAKAKYEAPAAAAMDRSHPPPPATSGDSGPKVNVRVGCSVM
mgnify:CR=1 FL=1